MGVKPANLCTLETGKLIDSQKNFVATFNWLKDFCNNMKGSDGKDGGLGITVDSSVNDHPVIKLTGEIPKAKSSSASTVTFVGTDGATYAECTTGRVTFASDEDSSVTVTPSADGAGNVTLTLVVYAKPTVTFVGTDGETTAECTTGRVTFASADDSNIVVTPSADADGNVTLTMGVYYK